MKAFYKNILNRTCAMGKSKNNGEKAKGEAGFHAYYAALFGGRWETLKAALSAEGAYAKWQVCGLQRICRLQARRKFSIYVRLRAENHSCLPL